MCIRDRRTPEGYFSKAEELKQALLSGSFPENIREQFKAMLTYYGQSPIIVRSSSFLEDGFGNAFAGKYESVFCVNFGTLETRLKAFEDAVRQVYASTMDISALEYRLQRGLEKKDEQMSILVQRVSCLLYTSCGRTSGRPCRPAPASRCGCRWSSWPRRG